MPRFARTFLCCSIIFTAGCQSGGPTVLKDQLPLHIPKSQTLSVIPVLLSKSVDETETTYSQGSAVILDKNHLLTARHVVETESEDWKETELPDEMMVDTFIKCEKGDDHLHINRQVYETISEEVISKNVDECSVCSNLLSDWAVLKTETPNWNYRYAASIYQPALDPEWIAPNDTPLYIAGYSPAFSEVPFNELCSELAESGGNNTVVDNGETYVTAPVKLHTFYRQGPYVIAAFALNTSRHEGHVQVHGIATPNNYPSIGGHSGGGVFVWNDKTELLELIGIITATNPDHNVLTTSHFAGSFLGIPYDFRHTKTEKMQLNTYVPIGHILSAWVRNNK